MSLSNLSTFMLDSKIKNHLNECSLSDFNSVLAPIVKKIKLEYRQGTNPDIILTYCINITNELESNIKYYNSFEIAKLLSIQSQMLLAIGASKELLDQALNYINESIEICYKINEFTLDINKELVKSTLILAVVLKALGDYDAAFKTISENSSILLNKRGISKLELIPLQRQEIMMTQSDAGHKKLLSEVINYKDLAPVEYYSTLKRVFEFSMNKNMYDVAEKLIPLLKDSFKLIKNELPILSHISFLKNIAMYYLTTNEFEYGVSLLEALLIKSSDLSMIGQVNQIKALLEQHKDGKRIDLMTYKL